MSDDVVSYEVRDRVAFVTITNGKANALSPSVVAALDAALTRAEDAGEEHVGALLIGGAPGMLSGGFDLAVMRSSAAAAGQLVTDGGTLITRLFGSEVPVVIACSGHTVAAGALLLLGADARIGARGAFRIGLIETQIGLVLPRWAAELAGTAVTSPAAIRDGRRADVRPRRCGRRRVPRRCRRTRHVGYERPRRGPALGSAAPSGVSRPSAHEPRRRARPARGCTSSRSGTPLRRGAALVTLTVRPLPSTRIGGAGHDG